MVKEEEEEEEKTINVLNALFPEHVLWFSTKIFVRVKVKLAKGLANVLIYLFSFNFFIPFHMFCSSQILFLIFGHFWWRNYENTEILCNLCLHFARQDGQDGKKWNKNHATKVTKIPKTKRQNGMNETIHVDNLNECPQ